MQLYNFGRKWQEKNSVSLSVHHIKGYNMSFSSNIDGVSFDHVEVSEDIKY